MDLFKLSRILSLQAEAFAVNAKVLGMKADNEYDEGCDKVPTYTLDDFEIESEKLYNISRLLMEAGH